MFWVGLIILALASVAIFAIVWYNAVMIQLKPAVEYQVPFIVGTIVFIFSARRLVRGHWQNIFLLELDGHRTRKIIVEIIGE